MIGALQRLLRWVFMHLEAVFNRAFGDRINPLYYLGATAFFLFWVVAGTGLYLYIFFDTAVSGAYASVESLTHGQRYIGGIARSVHRYASDGMVLTMTVHLLRHFAFDRLRGYRRFSWITGVILIWFVYVSGVGGYMLPWDRLAQFVTVSTFEWLDWLPGFGGALIRNVIYPESISDRFFSLLAFMHIGAPLLTLLLMWVHVQRVPKVGTNPPRPIALGMLATLVLLALWQPVSSQGGAADLANAVPQVALDWFYLAIYPLIHTLPLSRVWALVLSLTLLLIVLPWLPLRRKGEQVERRIEFHPGPRRVVAQPGETLLDAGLRAGLALPFECRNGGCQVCVCTVVQGEVDHGAYQPAALTDAMRANGKALMCCATALGEVAIEVDVESIDPGGVAPVLRREGRVESMRLLGADVMQIMLSLPGGERIEFGAGQYINILLDDGQQRAYSFANPPHDNALIELHVKRMPGGVFSTRVFESLKVGDKLRFEGPFGRFTLRPGNRPIVLVATSVGFAPIKSILEDAFHRGIRRPMRLYWGARELDDLYHREALERWQREHDNFTFIPVLSRAAGTDWSGRTGHVDTAILEDFPDLRGYEVYICGSVQLVSNAVPAFLAHGLSEGACFSDSFTPSTAAP
ncbi:MAG: Na(+)-translocating NADH-quinone reductase subunit F [Steroidobacteraceae bacterium]|nr:Na(+)-translocating NADH-quinone reductase subunit F [Steroidobacteraceae bacterium]